MHLAGRLPAEELALILERLGEQLKLPPQQLAQALADAVRFADDSLIGGVARGRTKVPDLRGAGSGERLFCASARALLPVWSC